MRCLFAQCLDQNPESTLVLVVSKMRKSRDAGYAYELLGLLMLCPEEVLSKDKVIESIFGRVGEASSMPDRIRLCRTALETCCKVRAGFF